LCDCECCQLIETLATHCSIERAKRLCMTTLLDAMSYVANCEP